MDRDQTFAALRAHRVALAEQLTELDDAQWETPSRCAGWRVRDVIGHLISVQRVPSWKLVIGV